MFSHADCFRADVDVGVNDHHLMQDNDVSTTNQPPPQQQQLQAQAQAQAQQLQLPTQSQTQTQTQETKQNNKIELAIEQAQHHQLQQQTLVLIPSLVELSKVDVEIPKVDVDLPKVELPKVELPKVEEMTVQVDAEHLEHLLSTYIQRTRMLRALFRLKQGIIGLQMTPPWSDCMISLILNERFFADPNKTDLHTRQLNVLYNLTNWCRKQHTILTDNVVTFMQKHNLTPIAWAQILDIHVPLFIRWFDHDDTLPLTERFQIDIKVLHVLEENNHAVLLRAPIAKGSKKYEKVMEFLPDLRVVVAAPSSSSVTSSTNSERSKPRQNARSKKSQLIKVSTNVPSSSEIGLLSQIGVCSLRFALKEEPAGMHKQQQQQQPEQQASVDNQRKPFAAYIFATSDDHIVEPTTTNVTGHDQNNNDTQDTNKEASVHMTISASVQITQLDKQLRKKAVYDALKSRMKRTDQVLRFALEAASMTQKLK